MANDLVYSVRLDTRSFDGSAFKAVSDSMDKIRDAAAKAGLAVEDLNLDQMNLIKQMRKMDAQLKAIQKRRDALMSKLSGASVLPKEMEELPGQASVASAGFDRLGMSIQQVAREMPAFAFSASTGFMAISNNLPILADAIQAVRKENEALSAQGKKTVPVWKQVAKSLLSWQTALVAGITALTMYGPEMIEYVRNLFSLSAASDQSRKSLETLRNTAKSYNTDLLQETNQLRYVYDAILNTSEGTAERRAAIQTLNDTYKEYMPYLLSEHSSLDELNTMYNVLNSSLRNHIALKVRNAQLDKITEEAAKSQSDAVVKLQEALSKQGVSTSLSDDIITTLVNSAPKWKAAGDTLRKAFLQAVKNIREDNPGIVFSRDAEKGVYDYIRSFYEMDTAIGAVNKRIDLLLGKNNQIKEIGEVVITPEKTGNKETGLGASLSTITGLQQKIQKLREAQNKASLENAVNLEKEIRLYQEKLNLLQLNIVKGANPEAQQPLPLISAGEAPRVEMPAVKLPFSLDMEELNRVLATLREKVNSAADEVKEITVVSSRQLTGMISTAFSGLGEALVSGNGLEALKQVLVTIMDMLQQFGTALIAAGTASIALKAVAWSGIGAVIAGGALVAATAAAKAALQKAATPFANGGIVSGPTYALVGEYAGARNNPEVIAPLDKLRNLIASPFTTDGLYLETKVRGKDLYVALRSVEYKNNRTR